jgi:hypothetical protein
MGLKLPIISYTLAVISGISFVGGLIIISSEGRQHIWTGSERSYPC